MRTLILFLLCTALLFSATVTYEWNVLRISTGPFNDYKKVAVAFSKLEKWQVELMKPVQLYGYASSFVVYVYPIRAITNK